LAGVLVYDLYWEKHLSLDGVGYLVGVLQMGSFMVPGSYRVFADVLTQWPLVLAVKANVIAMPILIQIFALGIFLPFPISFGLCVFALRGRSLTMLIFPLISILLINLTTDYILYAEYQAMTLLVWPILFLLLRPLPLGRGDGLLLLVLLALFSRTYETSMIPSVLFCGLIARQVFRERIQFQQRWIYWLALVVCVYSLSAAGYYSLFPEFPGNSANFLRQFLRPWTNPGMSLRVLFLAFWLAWFVYSKRGYRLVTLVSLGLLGVWYLIAPILFPNYLALERSVHVSTASRTFSVTLLPILLLLGVFVDWKGAKLTWTKASVFGIFLIFMAGVHVVDTGDWRTYRDAVRTTLRERSGYVPVETTIFQNNAADDKWNNPFLSVVWSAPCVETIILNGPEAPFVPFDPKRELILPGYTAYSAIFRDVVKGAGPGVYGNEGWTTAHRLCDGTATTKRD